MKRHLAQSLLWLVLLAVCALGQDFRATVTGRVADPTKAAVPGATIVVRNLATNEAATVTTNSEGSYTLPFIRPGIYSISVEKTGFRRYMRERQEFQVSQAATLDITLEIGVTSETVTILGDAPLLEATKADRGNVIENRRIVELPLNARNPFMLATLTPGITYNGPAIYQRPFDNGAIADWSINGGQNRNNEFLLDGAPNNSIQGGNNIAFVPPVDAVAEFKIITNSYDAQYGRTAGGVVNVQIKSGGNQYHGTLYEFLRRNWLDSNYLFSNARNIPAGRFRTAAGELLKAEHFLDQYGGQIDGPVRLPKAVFGPAGYDGRDRTFFLFNYEGYREGTPNPGVVTFPREEFLKGDFRELKNLQGQLIQLYDPATGRNVNGVWTRDPLQCNGVNNVICLSRINPVAAQLAGFYPRPNTTTVGSDPWRNNYADIPNIANDKFKNWVFKIDQVVGEKDRVFFRYGYNNRAEIRWTNAINTGPAQDGQLPLNRINHTGVIDWVHTFNGNLILNIRSSANRYVEESRSEPGLGYDATQLGFPSFLVGQLPTKMFPRIEITDFNSLGRNGFVREPTNAFSFQPNLSVITGAHSLRFGLDLRYTQYARQVSGSAGLRLTFDRTFTRKEFNRDETTSGNGLASFLLGAPTGGNIDFNVFPIYMFKYYAPWIQDDWKLTQRLTLNLGFRWDLNLPAVERYNRLNYDFNRTTVNPATGRIDISKLPAGVTRVLGGLGFAGVSGNPSPPTRFDKNNLQMRLGAAFSLNDKTVVRAGFGRYFVNPVGDPGYPNNGFSIQTPFVASPDGNRSSFFNLSNPFPTGVLQPPRAALGLETFLGQGFNYSNTQFETPYVDNFSLGIQRQLPWNSVVEVSYVGSRSRKAQSRFTGVNEPSLAFRDKCDVTKGGSRAFCDELVPNPFFNVAGFSGTRFTNSTISRFELNRPFPQFGGITELEGNEGRVWYNSLQVLLNKRFSNGLIMSATYTFSKMVEEAVRLPGSTQDDTDSYIDSLAGIKNRGLAFSDRPHRITTSGVWELPIGNGRRFFTNTSGFLNVLIGGWEIAPLYIYNSGRPWNLPTNVEIVNPNFGLKGKDQVRFVNGAELIQGVKPCVGQRNTAGQIVLTDYAVAYGCSSANFVIREPFQTRNTPVRDARVRRPAYHQFDVNLSKRFRITERTSFQFRLEAYNVTNTPMYDERVYNRTTTDSLFGSINKNLERQSNFPRFYQIGLKFLF